MGTEFLLEVYETNDREKLHRVFQRRRVRYMFCKNGHKHINVIGGAVVIGIDGEGRDLGTVS